jgi:sugar (pentulose or hexulose) kinase
VRSGHDSDSLAKAELARELNKQIREIGQSLTEPADASEELTFFCECGCLAPVRLTLATFDAAGAALAEGHSPPGPRS